MRWKQFHGYNLIEKDIQQDTMNDKPNYRWNSEFIKLVNVNICP